MVAGLWPLLMHLHLTIPASGSVVEPVPEECYPAVPLPRAPVSSRRDSFAQEVAVIESAPLCLTDRETDSLIDPALGGPAPTNQYLISFTSRPIRCFPGRTPWMNQMRSRNWIFHLFLLHQVFIGLYGRETLRSRLVPLCCLTLRRNFRIVPCDTPR